MDIIEVTFASDGWSLAGHLRLPDDRSAPLPAVVFTGPFTGVKEQVVGEYAARLTAAGYATLAFDHRNFGASGGGRRHHEDAAGKLRDLEDAVSWLQQRPEIDAGRIGSCGICLGGGYALRHAAFDPRVKALALVAGGYNDPREMRRGMGEERYRATLAQLADRAAAEYASGQVAYLPAVAAGGGEAVMAGDEPHAYYGTERGARPGWENRVTALSVRELLTLDAAVGADFVAPTPVVMVHGRTDAYCSPEGAAAVHERIAGPKDLLWLDTADHIDLYDNPAFVQPAVARVVSWFDRRL